MSPILQASLRKARPSILQTYSGTAPFGGVDNVTPANRMDEAHCLKAYNLIASEYGMRVRRGTTEWVTGITGLADNYVRSMLPFTGSAKDGTKDKLFGVSSSAIWAGTTSTGAPAVSIWLLDNTGDAGYGIPTVMVTAAGHFLVYCDEQNGLYVYTESSATWAKVAVATNQAWAASTSYIVGDKVLNSSKIFSCTTAGVSATSGGPSTTGTGIADGTAVWSYVSASTANSIGPSLADQRSSYAADPATFVFPVVWKGRLWFVEKDTGRAWFMPAGQIYGTATSVNMGAKFAAGGDLRGLYNWTQDGGNGIDDKLVAVSGGGDVAIYEGIDPAIANAFGMVGTWSVGQVPAGRQIASRFGGDLVILSKIGLVQLSRLIHGDGSATEYDTARISPVFNALTATVMGLPGWSIRLHPEENALIVTIPQGAGFPTTQLVMSLATKGWTANRGLPIYSSCVWGGKLYYGTTDGKIGINTGYVDGVTLADPSSFSPIAWSLVSGYQAIDGARTIQVQQIRPTILCDGGTPTYSVAARYGYDMAEAPPPSGLSASGSNLWGTGLWDTATWGGEYAPSQIPAGAVGMGKQAAIAVYGLSVSRTVLVGWDVLYTSGGLQ